MKFLALGDTHLGFLSGRTADARRKMADYAAQQFTQVVKQAITNKVDVVFHTGDIFNRSHPPDWARHQYYQAVELLLQEGIEFMAIPGNHDRGVLQPSLMDYMYSNYVVFNKLQSKEYDGAKIIGLPYVFTKHKQQQQKLKKMVEDFEGPSIVLTHQVFAGSWFGPHQFYFRYGDDVYNMRHFPKRCQVLSGHIHRSQAVQEGRVVYTGSTIRTSFQEAIEPKGYLLGEVDVTTNTIEIEFVAIESIPMVVIERNRDQLNLEELDEILESIEKPARILLRLLNQNVDYNLLNQLQKRYGTDGFPYFFISPKTPGVILEPLYRNFSTKFKAVEIKRTWTTTQYLEQ